MRGRHRLERRVSVWKKAGRAKQPRPVLGEDILDRSAFDDSWERLLATVLQPSSKLAEVIAYVTDGAVPQPKPGRSLNRGGNPLLTLQAAHRALVASPRVTLAVAAALDSAERQRFGQLVVGSWDFTNVVIRLLTPTTTVSLRDLDRLGPALGWAPDPMAAVAVLPSWSWANPLTNLVVLDGFTERLSRDIDLIRAALTPVNADHALLWERLHLAGPDVMTLLAEQLSDAATSASKRLRGSTLPLLRELSDPSISGHLQTLAETAKPAQRARAIELLIDITAASDAAEYRAWLDERAAADRSSTVREAIERARSRLDEDPSDRLDAPSLPSVDLSPVEALTLKPVGRLVLRSGLGATMNGGVDPRRSGSLFQLKVAIETQPQPLKGVRPGHVARVLLTNGLYSLTHLESDLPQLPLLDYPSPMELAAVAAIDHHPPVTVIGIVAVVAKTGPDLWNRRQVTDLVEFYSDDIITIIDSRTPWGFDRSAMYELLETVTRLPPALETALVNAVFAGYNNDRPSLFRLVGDDKADLVLEFLTSRKKAERLGAAEWLKAHPVEHGVDQLRAAARSESDDRVKATLLAVLESLGASLEEFLGPETLLAEATKAMAKPSAMPKALAWLHVEALPSLTWSDGSTVDPAIIKWFLASAVKNKSAEPSPILRRHFANMKPEQVERFGATLLDWWFAEDLRAVTDDEARAEARKYAPQQHQARQRQSQWAALTLQQVEDQLTEHYLQTLTTSATTSKGLLAVVAASAGAGVTDKSLAYIRKHRGHRVSQAKSLLQMLAWIDEPATVQAVMSVATRFRPKGIQNEALNQAGLLAERHGWTLDDLADRSIPSGGFEADGRQTISYGDRTFTAHLVDDLSITLINDTTGKSIKSLPAAKTDEDPDLIKDARSDLAAAKKDLKSVLTLQPDRLQMAMAIQRTWSPDDFERYLLNHPVMMRLATRLVWLATTPNDVIGFRPLTDGSLITVDDEDLTLDPSWSVHLAHEQLLDPDGARRWQQHFADYEVAPLFAQFGRPGLIPENGQRVVADLVGFMHDDGSLRSQMNRYGWQMGTALDAGIVYEIVKDIPSEGITAGIEILGGIPAGAYDVGTWACAIGEFYFVRSNAPYIRSENAIPLADVPPILLTELYAEVQAIANAGTGFDPDHAKKVN